MPVNVNNDNFKQEVLESEKPVLVDFWAEWCMPCKMVEPVVEQIDREYSDKLKVCKLNIDEAKDIATKYQVMSIPSLAVFKNGEVKDMMVGAIDKNSLVEKIRPFWENN